MTFLLFFTTLIYITYSGNTRVTIDSTNFKINNIITYPNAKNLNVRGLLLNSRMIQGVFDDANTSTIQNWIYPDTHKWDPIRQNNEFVSNLTQYKSYGLLSFTVGLQGGGPDPKYPSPQPWIVSGFNFENGNLIKPFWDRLYNILLESDKLNMAPIVQFFYWGQVSRFNKNNVAINASISNALDQLISWNFNNILIDVANECQGGGYSGTILHCNDDMYKTIFWMKNYIKQKTGKTNTEQGIYIGSSVVGVAPDDNLVNASDMVLIHGNGKTPTELQDMINSVKNTNSYKNKPRPIIVNEDPNFNFNENVNNMEVAISSHVSWGYYDQGQNDYVNGYQSPPTNWLINTNNKKAFFNQVQMYTSS